ncbi:MAG TPA: hypothetical protein VEC57_03755 [Candidatus Limnocylindrales bacterium]|nr:hypothetical protein [Candidatus Limnocylindrales bacterium]
MSDRRKFLVAAIVAVVGAIAFGAFSFRREVASIQRRQGLQAAQCSTLVREARELVDEGRELGSQGGDYCRARDRIAQAVSRMQEAQRICRQALDQDPMLTSDAAIARMKASRADLADKCTKQGL